MTAPVNDARTRRFPIGASVSADALARDPYPIYERMREAEPISWVPALGMYYVVRYADVERILRDVQHFTVGTESSTLYDTFGEHMLTVEDPLHARYRGAFAPSFLPGALRGAVETQVRGHVDALIDGFVEAGTVEFREAFASRLPILTMLSLFGLPREREGDLRLWYDSFERALANFAWEPDVRARARENVRALLQLIREGIQGFRERPDPTALLSVLANAPTEERLDDEVIARNALIVLFGGISTVEALILNALYALELHRGVREQVRADPSRIPAVLEETMRWAGPVQSATRHVARDVTVAGVELRAGDTVNCMIAAANRDPAKFASPNEFDIARPGLRHHLGFALGTHHCLGSNLAKLEARIAIDRVFSGLEDWHVLDMEAAAPWGNEFRQPRQLPLQWRGG